MAKSIQYLTSLITDAERLGLVIFYDLELSGTRPQSYAAAVQVISAAAHAMGSRPDQTTESIHLRFHRHPHHYQIRAQNPESRIARLLGTAVQS